MTKETTYDFAAPPQRYDDTLAHEGIDLPVIDEAGNYRGTWIVTLRDNNDQRYRAAEIRYLKTNSNRLRGIKDEALRNMDKLVDLSVVGWKDIKDKSGKDIPFSKDVAKQFLSQEARYYDLNYLWYATAQTDLFQADEDMSKETEAGN